MTKVTVWLTSYNHGIHLRESIESVLNQTYRDYELYIVDDCSTDDSKAVIEKYQKTDRRIKTIFHEKNIGESGLKWEIGHLLGEYIAILHGDDKWEDTKLEKQVKYLDEHAEVEACFTGVSVIDENGNKYEGNHAYKRVFQEKNRTRYQWLRYFFDNGNCLCHPSLLIRKQAYFKYNLLSEGLNSLPDFDKWIKICMNRDIYIIPEKLTCFRVHDSEKNASGDTAEKQKRLFIEEYLVYQNYFNITNINDLLQIFPEAERYVIDGKCEISFAIAKMFLEGDRESKHLLGINKIYELCQDKEKWRKIKKLYKYDTKEFDVDKQRYDIFGMISNERFLKTTLYVDYGSGYNEESAIKKIVYVPATKIVRICFNVEKEHNDNSIKAIRFDIDEGSYRKCRIIEGHWTEKKDLCVRAINGVTKGDYDYFYTNDPQYEFEVGEGKLDILLETEIIESQELDGYIQSITREKEEALKNKEEILTEKKYIEEILQEYRKHISIRALHKLLKKIG